MMEQGPQPGTPASQWSGTASTAAAGPNGFTASGAAVSVVGAVIALMSVVVMFSPFGTFYSFETLGSGFTLNGFGSYEFTGMAAGSRLDSSEIDDAWLINGLPDGAPISLGAVGLGAAGVFLMIKGRSRFTEISADRTQVVAGGLVAMIGAAATGMWLLAASVVASNRAANDGLDLQSGAGMGLALLGLIGIGALGLLVVVLALVNPAKGMSPIGAGVSVAKPPSPPTPPAPPPAAPTASRDATGRPGVPPSDRSGP